VFPSRSSPSSLSSRSAQQASGHYFPSVHDERLLGSFSEYWSERATRVTRWLGGERAEGAGQTYKNGRQRKSKV
jgi:hypothetical protein